MTDLQNNTDFKLKIFDALYHGESIDHLIKLSYQLLSNPIMLTDESFHKVCLYRTGPVSDPVWQNVETLGYCSEESVITFRDDTNSQKLFKQAHAFLYHSGIAAKMPRILARVIYKNQTLGYLIVFSAEHPLTQANIEIVNTLA